MFSPSLFQRNTLCITPSPSSVYCIVLSPSLFQETRFVLLFLLLCFKETRFVLICLLRFHQNARCIVLSSFVSRKHALYCSFSFFFFSIKKKKLCINLSNSLFYFFVSRKHALYYSFSFFVLRKRTLYYSFSFFVSVKHALHYSF